MTIRLSAPERRAQLIEAALAVFSNEGYQATTMDAVAAEAGVTKPVLYQHFPSKRSLFLVLLADVGHQLNQMVSEAVAEADSPREQVEQGFHAFFRFISDHPERFRLLFGEGVRADAEFSAELVRVERTIADFIAQHIEIEGLHPDERLILAHGMVGLAEATGRHLVASGRSSDHSAFAARVAAMAWGGLRGRPNDDDWSA